MSKDAKNVPALRFKGYSDAWEKRKSKALFSPSSQKGRPNLPVVSVTQDSGVVFRDKMDINIDYDRSTLGSYKVVKPGDFIISLRSFQGGFELSDKVGITSPAYTIFNFKKPEEHFSDFWKYLFKRYLFVQSLKSVTFGIRDGRSISFKDFSDLNIIFPSSKKEEETISRLLGLIDDLIAATQYSIDALEQAKKALLQRLFDQSWRFKGHSDPWEKRKLQELLVERNDPSIESKTYPLMSFTGTDGVTPKGRRYDRSALVKSSSKKYKKTQKNDLIYSSNNLETGSIGLNKTGNAVISPVYSVFQVTDEAIPSFMGNMILRRRFIDKMLRYRQGIMYGQWRIHELDFLQIVVNVPQTAEQFQIGQLFSALDALIAATQSRLSSLELLKKSLLQDLFI